MARARGRLRAARRGIVAVAGGGACGRPARVARARGAHVFLSRSCVVWVFVSLFFFSCVALLVSRYRSSRRSPRTSRLPLARRTVLVEETAKTGACRWRVRALQTSPPTAANRSRRHTPRHTHWTLAASLPLWFRDVCYFAQALCYRPPSVTPASRPFLGPTAHATRRTRPQMQDAPTTPRRHRSTLLLLADLQQSPLPTVAPSCPSPCLAAASRPCHPLPPASRRRPHHTLSSRAKYGDLSECITRGTRGKSSALLGGRIRQILPAHDRRAPCEVSFALGARHPLAPLLLSPRLSFLLPPPRRFGSFCAAWAAAMLFCPACANLLLLERSPSHHGEVDATGSLRFFCRTCAYIHGVGDRRLTKSVSRLPRKVVDDVLGGEDAWALADKTETVCPKCGGHEAFFFQMQTRSADEPMSTFYRCVACQHQWKEN